MTTVCAQRESSARRCQSTRPNAQRCPCTCHVMKSVVRLAPNDIREDTSYDISRRSHPRPSPIQGTRLLVELGRMFTASTRLWTPGEREPTTQSTAAAYRWRAPAPSGPSSTLLWTPKLTLWSLELSVLRTPTMTSMRLRCDSNTSYVIVAQCGGHVLECLVQHRLANFSRGRSRMLRKRATSGRGGRRPGMRSP